ncbi:uncharacterized protein LOC116173183 isoform X2 [Photinus pyralis]|uniref:uncharacterized protein LOC116173183 isoform X2 n=2 Tax=Photinus pyralis TaxID=7054 RepID=UPI0012672E9C|nr:uncharacterized protein LOC116173183 isoform X2 [Photinus pyralis]
MYLRITSVYYKVFLFLFCPFVVFLVPMASPNNTWTVVCFTNDETVEAVPTKWLSGDQCLWPVVTRDKLNTYIRKCEFNSCWPSHTVRTFRNATYDNYSVARSKANKAENTSDLNTDCDDGPLSGKRKRKKKVISSSSDDSSDTESMNEKRANKGKMPSPPAWTDDEHRTHKDSHQLAEPEACIDELEEQVVVVPPVIESLPSTSIAPSQQENEINNITPRKPIDSIKENIRRADRTKCCCNPALLYNIQALLIEINNKLNSVPRKAEENEENIIRKSGISFPMETIQEFDKFEKFFSARENYLALVGFFSSIGGANLYEFVRRCLAPLLWDGLSEQFSFFGKKGNLSFGDKNLAKIIIEAAEKGGHAKNKKEVEQKLGDWLRRSKERRIRAEHKRATKK